MSPSRWLRHLFATPWGLRRAFTPAVQQAITEAVRQTEGRHAGEIRFVVEGALGVPALWRRLTPRQRAAQLFAELKVWDTEHNNGVLIYVLYAERSVEIVADRGVGDARVPAAEWQHCAQRMTTHFAGGDFAGGAVAGVQAVAEVLARYPPARPDVGNELPDSPVLL
ncbi:TLP18.3, Psb32 and MOLO-1 founding protein of phosphatase [Solimonas aquatica]|uniref:TLP18.3, Psb32 and MOLO-1 founding protein of phosphatase n=1 Tax=Solimonas aquatica TaxID=489703 RepID=A0A1H9FTS1_9GAMM|nr:TPM domain-containing protein [Solimonas aquatica]SEQ41304.1 TLP18.3, Psb32 and MOLO-1 founding protein of phosphatase [Solimonas aquatica]